MTALPRQCTSCERPLEPASPYYRFALAIEGEQDVIDTTGGQARDELQAALAQLEAGPEDPTYWDEQVHLERSGLLCADCRARLLSLLGGPEPRAPLSGVPRWGMPPKGPWSYTVFRLA